MDFMYEICDYFYVLSGGRIITEGKKEQVFEDDKAIQEAKLEVPYVVRLHNELGFPLYENHWFAVRQNNFLEEVHKSRQHFL